MNKRTYITKDRVDRVAEELKKATEVLTAENASATCYRILLDDEDLAIFVGWEDGFDADDDWLYITGARKTSPTDKWTIGYALCCGVKVRCDAYWADYECLRFPCDAEGNIPWCGESTITKDDNYKALAKDLLEAYVGLRNMLEKGKISL